MTSKIKSNDTVTTTPIIEKIDGKLTITGYNPVVNGKQYSHIAETEDVALIVGLGIKYDGLNSRFAQMACRMLQIDTEWSK